MTETNQDNVPVNDVAESGKSDTAGAVDAAADAKSAASRGRGRKLRTPFRRRRGDAVAEGAVDSAAS
ncbi:MAG TPA: 23S rRNA pseudouridylate synthase B, partial [Eoetvoesiella sp.]